MILVCWRVLKNRDCDGGDVTSFDGGIVAEDVCRGTLQHQGCFVFVLVLLVVDGLDKVWRRRMAIQPSIDINGSQKTEENAPKLKKGMDWAWMGVMGLLGVATTIRMGGVFVLGWAMLWPVLQGLNNYKAAVKSPILEKLPSVGNASSGFMVFQKRDWVWLISGLFAFAIGYIGSYPYLWFTGLDGLMQVLSFAFNNPWPNGALFLARWSPRDGICWVGWSPP